MGMAGAVRLGRLPALAALLTCFASGFGAWAQEQQIVVEAPSARSEIERILEADNLNNADMDPAAVVAAMRRIDRRYAPDDFWAGYRQHVEAWERFAAIASDPGSTTAELAAARGAVNASFDVVERIARRYNAQLPRPAAQKAARTKRTFSVSSASS